MSKKKATTYFIDLFIEVVLIQALHFSLTWPSDEVKSGPREENYLE